jgi:hypothetical protein
VILKGGRGKKGKNMHTKKGRKRKITPTLANNTPKIESLVEEGDLEMDLPSEYDELSTIDPDNLDYDSSDIDDRTNGHGRYSNKTTKKPAKRQKLMKTQAQSTYMMEKSFETKSKKGNGGASAGGLAKKVKAPRKDKGVSNAKCINQDE